MRRPLPRIDKRPLLAGARRGSRNGLERPDDGAARIRWVDHIIERKRDTGVECLAPFVGRRDQLVVPPLAHVGIADRREFIAEAELHLALQAHPAVLGGGPCNCEERSFRMPARHGLRSETVGLPQNDRDQWHR